MRRRLLFTIIVSGSAAAATAATIVTLADEQWYSEGPWLPYAAPWCADYDSSLIAGSTYRNTISFTRGTLPKAVRYTYRYPATKSTNGKCGVYGYDFLAWGNYDGGATATPVTSRMVSNIGDLVVTYDATINGAGTNVDGLMETFLTRVAGQAGQKAIEIGTFWHAPALTQAYMAASTPIGTFTDRWGRAFTVARSTSGAAGNYYMFMFADRKSHPKGAIDLRGELAWLRKRGVVSGSWWFNGLAFGVEPIYGSGSFTINSVGVAYS